MKKSEFKKFLGRIKKVEFEKLLNIDIEQLSEIFGSETGRCPPGCSNSNDLGCRSWVNADCWLKYFKENLEE